MLKTRPVVIRKELLDHYNELGINERELVILIKLIYASETTNKLPYIESLQKGSSLDSREITAIIQNLIQRDLLELNVNKDEEGKFTEYMNLDQFYHKLNDIMQHVNNNSNQKQVELEFNKLFKQNEQAFGRPLSP